MRSLELQVLYLQVVLRELKKDTSYSLHSRKARQFARWAFGILGRRRSWSRAPSARSLPQVRLCNAPRSLAVDSSGKISSQGRFFRRWMWSRGWCPILGRLRRSLRRRENRRGTRKRRWPGKQRRDQGVCWTSFSSWVFMLGWPHLPGPSLRN